MIWISPSNEKSPLASPSANSDTREPKPPPKGRLVDSITHGPPGNQERTEYIMKNLIETAKATKVPEKYELRASDLDTLYREAHGDVFRMISWAFKIGFHQGQKAGDR